MSRPPAAPPPGSDRASDRASDRPAGRRSGGGLRARLKLVAVGSERLLLVRFVPFSERVRKTIGLRLEQAVPAAAFACDGEVYRVRGAPAIKGALAVIKEEASAVYDPNLLRELPALPNPWPIPAEPPRDFSARPRVYMARVRHPRLAEALAFQLPGPDDDFLIEFRRRLAQGKEWRDYRGDLELWAVAEHYQPLVHEVLDEFYACVWDDFLGGDEWDVLPPPPDSQYPLRAVEDRDFHILGVEPGCSVWEIQAAYRDRKEDYKENRLPPDEWYDIDTAFHRLDRHYRPASEDDVPEQVVAPREVVLALRALFPSEPTRVAWYHRHQDALGAIPADLAATPEGLARVTRALDLMLLLAGKKPPAPRS